MDGSLIIIALIVIVNAVVKWAKKQQTTGGQPNRGAAPDKPWQRMLGELAQTIEGSSSGRQQLPGTTLPKASANPSAPAVWQEGDSGTEGLSTPNGYPEMTPNTANANYSAPPRKQWHGSLPRTTSSLEGLSAAGEYTEMTPNVADAVYSASPRQQGHGSLPGTTSSISFTAAQPYQAAVEPASAPQSGLGLSFSRDSLVQAVVMNEILTRPRDRKRRWSGH